MSIDEGIRGEGQIERAEPGGVLSAAHRPDEGAMPTTLLRAQRRAEVELRKAKDELERQTAQLAAQSELLRATLEATADGVLGFDLGGRVVVRNTHFERIFNVPAGLLDGKSDDALVNHMRTLFVDADRFVQVVNEQRLRPETTNLSQFLLADGRLLERYGAPQIIAGRCVGYVVRWRDVTESRRAEAALAAKSAAEQANIAKSVFLARMSHELRTPLNAIIGFSDTLLFDRPRTLEPDQISRLSHIRKAGGDLLHLINDILDVSRLEAGLMKLQLADVDVSALANEAVAQIQPMVDSHRVKIDIDVPSDSACTVRADSARLNQVVLNLLTNAVKYNRPGGHVYVRAARTLQHGNDLVILRVQDTGIGMTADQLAHLFQPFNRLGREHSAIHGTGIGLVIARSMTELMGGRMTVNSEPDRGTTFVLEFPAVSQHWSEVVTGSSVGASTIQRRTDISGHVLYVDDNEVNRVLMESFLSWRPNLKLTLAEDGKQGLQAALEVPPNLILLDLLLPEMDGYAILRALRQQSDLTMTPVLALSANAMPEDIARAEAAGFNGYLTKPLALEKFLSEIDRWLSPKSAEGN